jgi:hypothetical protein
MDAGLLHRSWFTEPGLRIYMIIEESEPKPIWYRMNYIEVCLA